MKKQTLCIWQLSSKYIQKLSQLGGQGDRKGKNGWLSAAYKLLHST